MFEERSDLLATNPSFKGYGAAVTVGPQGPLTYVTSSSGANRLLRCDADGGGDGALVDIATGIIADRQRRGIAVAAADVDGDGREEVYVQNAGGYGRMGGAVDRLFDCDGTEWIDAFSLEVNAGRSNRRDGWSVAAVDRHGTGRYGLLVASDGSPMRCYELGDDGEVTDMAESVGLDVEANVRALASGPLVTERMDVFAATERGPNRLLRNDGGQFTDVAAESGVADATCDARCLSFVGSGAEPTGEFVCGNWEGPTRLFARTDDRFRDVAPPELAQPTRTRSVVAADFDNDGSLELFVNALGAPNRLFERSDGTWRRVGTGEALEPKGLGTGATAADFDGDGTLELLVVHGEAGAQPLSIFRAPNDNDWLRVRPLTEAGAPARGASVTLETTDGVQSRLVDAGSGGHSQSEPVAHFGLGDATPSRLVTRWPDGRVRVDDDPVPRTEQTVAHPAG
ncbi:CRTAC1 family protein [Haloprofundus sp. MHR1]|uniref:CRTAC1 family protein n=1 Tax=Haloprofundus sp. MHR1 TaxID=2572921 RepID=UPI0010BE853C|nr:CRTAC1 family protein [Haloprofundus sp. MHR1]QCJ48213.1 CRTAC1 family protein [Haloprofundus sp. MHR1]